MKRIHVIATIIIASITLFCIWSYIERVNFHYNSEGKYFSIKNTVVYYEQTKAVYALLAILGFIITLILIIKLIKNDCAKSKKTNS